MKNYRRLSAAIFFLLITLLLIISLTESTRWLFLLSALMPIFVVAQVVGVLRHRAGGLSLHTLRGDIAAAVMVGTFVFLLIAVAR